MCLKCNLALISKSEGVTREIGRLIGEFACSGLLVALSGGLGMGKTKLTQGIGDALGISRVKSPTFILVNEHESTPPLIHADLYRLETQREIDTLDLESYLENDCLLVVEWAEYWKNIPKDKLLTICFEKISENERKLAFEAFGEVAQLILDKIKNNFGALIC